MSRVSKAALCAAALLAACTTTQEVARGTPGVCNPGVCFVDINVKSCTAPDGITANPVSLDVERSNNIQWTITTENFKFAATDGIVFTDPQFSGGRATDNGRKFIVHDDFTSKGSYKYTVKLVDGNGHPCLPYDPFVNNK